jgi:bisphosphoglycerate-dependent phosphoglycerate mutase
MRTQANTPSQKLKKANNQQKSGKELIKKLTHNYEMTINDHKKEKEKEPMTKKSYHLSQIDEKAVVYHKSTKELSFVTNRLKSYHLPQIY